MSRDRTCPHCGGSLIKARSLPDHRRLFGVIRAAFDNWPHDHDFTPDDAEHLRAYLLCKAGYSEMTPIEAEFASERPAMARLVALSIEAALRAANGHAFVRVHGDRIGVFKPKSIAFDKLSQRDFVPIREAVEAVIETELGVTADDLLKSLEAA
jgi:hypothetical protein